MHTSITFSYLTYELFTLESEAVSIQIFGSTPTEDPDLDLKTTTDYIHNSYHSRPYNIIVLILILFHEIEWKLFSFFFSKIVYQTITVT